MTKRALVVGINDYTALFPNGKKNLNSCVDDANSMHDLLITSFGFDSGESIVRTDQGAGSSDILAALQGLIAKSEPGDVICFYYSGHGSRTPAEPDKADCDRFYESIIPASGPPITDRMLYDIANTLEQSVINFTVILDSCHSGGMDQETDAVKKCRSFGYPDDLLDRIEQYLHTLIPCGICITTDAEVCNDNVSNVTAAGGRISLDEDPDKAFVPLAKTTLLAACRFNEISWETDGHGLLTKAFLDIVNQSDFRINHSDLLDQLRTRVSDYFTSKILPNLSEDDPKSQTPQLRGQQNRMEEEFLGAWADCQ